MKKLYKNNFWNNYYTFCTSTTYYFQLKKFFKSMSLLINNPFSDVTKKFPLSVTFEYLEILKKFTFFIYICIYWRWRLNVASPSINLSSFFSWKRDYLCQANITVVVIGAFSFQSCLAFSVKIIFFTTAPPNSITWVKSTLSYQLHLAFSVKRVVSCQIHLTFWVKGTFLFQLQLVY